ncbi:MAG: hypothetical protein AVDCRST_MAG35-2809, partial [uncultured Quadrisphaera sp.]
RRRRPRRPAGRRGGRPGPQHRGRAPPGGAREHRRARSRVL